MVIPLALACTDPAHDTRSGRPGMADTTGDTWGGDTTTDGDTATSGTTTTAGDTATTGATAPIHATNPVIAGDHPDPGVLRTVDPDGTVHYWLVATVDSGADIPVWTSSDLVHWEVATTGLFGVSGTPGSSIEIHGYHYCHVWAPELTELGPDSYMLSFTATRYTTPQSPCPDYAEDSGVYLAWSSRPTGPFADDDHPWEPLPAGGQISTCALRDELPRSLDTASPDCQGGYCHQVIRLDSNVTRDPTDGRWWLAYAWYTNDPPLVDWETTNLGEHVSLVELDASDPYAVECDTSVPQIHAANPHDTDTLARLAASCDGCDAMLSNTRGRYGEEMTREGYSWGVAEAPALVRHGDLVYLFVSGSAWDSAYYHVYWVAAPTVEELSWENPDRRVGRFLIPSEDQAFGHGSVVLGPDGEHLYMVHHHLDHAACLAGDCSRDVWVTPLEFDGEDIVPVRPAEVEGFDAR
jgi:hypothetical protein